MIWSTIENLLFRDEELPPAWQARAKDLECYFEDARAFLEASATGPLGEAICFIHVPKCAGITVDSAIRRAYRSIWERDGESLRRLDPGAADRGSTTSGVSTWQVRETVVAYYLALQETRYVSGHFQVSEGLLDRFADEYAFVTLLRHPVDRWISHYLYNTYTPDDHTYHIDVDLEEFLETERAREIGEIFVSYFSGEGARSSDQPGDVEARFERARSNLARLELVGFVERMEEFRHRFRERFGADLHLMRRNVNPASDDEKTVEPQVRERIREVCREDIALYEEALARFADGGEATS